jgi:HPt (histidine-containing phosphotransfer) domain-containing protein
MTAQESLQPMFSLLAQLPAPVRDKMVGMYRDSLASQLAQLGQLLEAGDVAALQAVAHKLAGAAAMMQDRELSQVARSMEVAVTEDRAEAARQAWPRIQARARITLDALQPAAC